jgi:uncharacterized Zn finger protein (UPF0148 family)
MYLDERCPFCGKNLYITTAGIKKCPNCLKEIRNEKAPDETDALNGFTYAGDTSDS